ncbi:MAG: type IV pilus biogenesis protein PilM [Desulfovibrio sp.]|jgi:hypothetical protein|nr:type IV pilus biogenesis protein PilM [Desulfovibrio sp.]
MKALAVLTFLVGVMALVHSYLDWTHQTDVNPPAKAAALNYVIFRNGALWYALTHSGVTGDISSGVLDLPAGWRAVRTWRARVDSGRCYVWGTASSEEIAAARRLLWGSQAVGRNENGRLAPGNGAEIPIPSFVGNGDLVSVISLE